MRTRQATFSFEQSSKHTPCAVSFSERHTETCYFDYLLRLLRRVLLAAGLLHERVGRQVDLLHRLQIFHHFVGVLASQLCVKMQTEAVRSLGINELRLEREEGF